MQAPVFKVALLDLSALPAESDGGSPRTERVEHAGDNGQLEAVADGRPLETLSARIWAPGAAKVAPWVPSFYGIAAQ